MLKLVNVHQSTESQCYSSLKAFLSPRNKIAWFCEGWCVYVGLYEPHLLLPACMKFASSFLGWGGTCSGKVKVVCMQLFLSGFTSLHSWDIGCSHDLWSLPCGLLSLCPLCPTDWHLWAASFLLSFPEFCVNVINPRNYRISLYF